MSETPEKKAAGRPKHQLDLGAKLRQRSVVQRVKAVDWDRTSLAPMVVELDPTTACNLACPDCISRDLLNQGFLSRDRLRRLAEEFVEAEVKAVILIGGGEPLAHPEIGWVIDYLGRNGVQIGITTNGLMIKRYLEPIARYANWVRVSMDAGTSETFGRIRPTATGKSAFDEAVDNMRALAPVRTGKLGYSFMIYAEGKFDLPPVGAAGSSAEELEASQMARDMLKLASGEEYSNVSEIYQAAVLARDIGCDYFEVKPMYDINHFAVSHRERLMEEAKEQIQRALELETDDFRVLQATKLRHVLDGEGNIEPKDYRRCAVSQLRTLVTPSGVYVCPYFRGRDDKRVGDVRKTSFVEMWQGEARQKVMDVLDPSVDCRMHCIRHQSNLILEEMIASEEEVETLEDFDFFI